MNLTYIRPFDITLSTEKALGSDEALSPSNVSELFSESFSHYYLQGRDLHGKKIEDEHHPRLFSIHGARSDYTSLNSILNPLQLLGISSLSFNLSGHSAASGVEIEASSLGKNLQESLYMSCCRGGDVRNILGFSLGGALALKVAEAHKDSVQRIVLLAPALYTEQAYQVPFGPLFKKVIYSPFSFLDSTSLSFLKSFRGKVLLIMGEYDGLSAKEFGRSAGTSVGNIRIKHKILSSSCYYSAIPSEVVSAIEQHVNPDNFQKIILSGCDHSIMSWLKEKPEVAKQLSQEIADFLTSR